MTKNALPMHRTTNHRKKLANVSGRWWCRVCYFDKSSNQQSNKWINNKKTLILDFTDFFFFVFRLFDVWCAVVISKNSLFRQKFDDGVSGHRLGALDRVAESARPDPLRQHTQGTRHTEHDGVVALLLQTVVHQQAATVRVDVWPRVLGFAVLGQHTRRNLVHLSHQFEQFVVWQVFQCVLTLCL